MEAPITGSKIMEPMFADTKISYIFAPQLNVMGKFKKRHNGMKQTREPPNFDIY